MEIMALKLYFFARYLLRTKCQSWNMETLKVSNIQHQDHQSGYLLVKLCVCGDPKILISEWRGHQVQHQHWQCNQGRLGDWMCLMQDGEEFSIDQGYVNVKGAQDAMTTLSRDHHAPDTRLLRVIEDTDCEQPSVTWSALEHVETVDNLRLVT